MRGGRHCPRGLSRRDAALAALELAHLYLVQNRTKEVRRLAFQAEAKLRKLGIEHKAEEAVALFWKAAQQEAATPGLAEETIETLRRARPEPIAA